MQSYHRGTFLSIEIIYLIAVIGIILANFFILTYVSAKNNTVTRNLATATKLVQESVKEMVNISGEKTEKLIVINGHFYNWEELFNSNLSFPPCGNPLDPESTCSDFLLSACPPGIYSNKSRCIIRDTHSFNLNTWKITQDATHFSKKIRIIDAGGKTKKVTVLVWWTDSLGLHKSVITRILEK